VFVVAFVVVVVVAFGVVSRLVVDLDSISSSVRAER